MLIEVLLIFIQDFINARNDGEYTSTLAYIIIVTDLCANGS